MDEDGARGVLRRFGQFADQFADCFGRRVQRDAASHYLAGLVNDSERKSMQAMHGRLSDAGTYQALQHFITDSPWPTTAVWTRLRELIPERRGILAVDDTGFPKQGTHSVGVERQYSGTLGKVGNCQVAVSLHHVGAHGHAVLGWRLYLPERWATDPARRQAAGIPEEVVFQPKWQLGLDLIDQARAWGLADRIVVADAGYGDATEFRDGLEARHLAYVVGIAATVGVWTRPPKAVVPPYGGRGQPPTRYAYGKQRPVSAQAAVAEATGWTAIRWRQGTQGWLTSRFLALRVQPSHGFVQGDPPHKAVWLLAEWPEAEPAPTKYWLGDLPPSTTLRRLVRVAKCRWAIEQDYQQLKEELGLDHYEGRGWIGWHHHLTLVMLAHAFLTLETLRRKKNCWVDAPADAP